MKRLLFVAFALQVLTVLPVQGKTYEGVDGVIEPEVVAVVKDEPVALSPDGKWLLAQIHGEMGGPGRGVSLINLKTGDRTVLLKANFDGIGAHWFKDGKTFLFNVGRIESNAEKEQLGSTFVGTIDKRAAVLVPNMHWGDTYLSVSPNQRRQILLRGTTVRCVWIKSSLDERGFPQIEERELPLHGFAQLPGPWRLTQASYSFVWQRDDVVWAFPTSHRSPTMKTGTPQRPTLRLQILPQGVKVTEEHSPFFSNSVFSPNGKYCYQPVRYVNQVLHAGIFAADAGASQKPLIDIPKMGMSAHWSPDSKLLASSVLRELVDKPVPGQEFRVVTLAGKTIAYIDGFPDVIGWQAISAVAWSADSQRLLLHRSVGSELEWGAPFKVAEREVGSLVLDLKTERLWKLGGTKNCGVETFEQFAGGNVLGYRIVDTAPPPDPKGGYNGSLVRRTYQILRWRIPSSPTQP